MVDREITDALKALGRELRATKGKHTYKFLPPPLKAQVDNVLERVTQRDPVLRSMYEEYLDSQKELVLTYASNRETLDKKFAEIENSFFHPYCGFEDRRAGRAEVTRHNIIIQAAERYAGPTVRKNQLRTVHAKSQRRRKQQIGMVRLPLTRRQTRPRRTAGQQYRKNQLRTARRKSQPRNRIWQ